MSPENDWSVELEHRVSGSPDEVFDYFTDPEKYRRWQGQKADLDPRPGGLYQVTVAPDVRIRGKYVAVERPRRVMMTWGFESILEIPRGLAQVPPGSSTVEFSFEPDGDGTIIRVRHTGLPSDEAREAHQLGWDAYVSRLATVTQGADPGRDPVIRLTAALFDKDAEVAARSSNR
jgi:uncharacterized protein YndB with AHSA1/START domain